MDAAKLNEAVEFMKSHETASPRRDFSDQEIVNGQAARVDSDRARRQRTGLIIRRGYIVAEFGDTHAPRSDLQRGQEHAVDHRRHRARSRADSASSTIRLRTSSRTAATTRRRTAASPGAIISSRNRSGKARCGARTPTSSAREAFGRAEMKPRAIQAARRLSTNTTTCASTASRLSLLRVFKKPMPDVFRDEVMNPIGASTTWKWVPYTNAYVDIDGTRMASVSGGTRWGGGMWINSYDMARFGLLWLRNGKWGDKQIVSPGYVKMATTPSAHGPDYGFLWWLNTKQAQWPGSPANAFERSARAATSSSFRRATTSSWSGDGARSRPKASGVSSPPLRADRPRRMNLAYVSLAALVVAILVSCFTELNVGILALALAWIVGVYVGGMPLNDVIAGFPVSLFLTLAGVTLLFCAGAAEPHARSHRSSRGARVPRQHRADPGHVFRARPARWRRWALATSRRPRCSARWRWRSRAVRPFPRS